jgi:hypothetical protein
VLVLEGDGKGNFITLSIQKAAFIRLTSKNILFSN